MDRLYTWQSFETDILSMDGVWLDHHQRRGRPVALMSNSRNGKEQNGRNIREWYRRYNCKFKRPQCMYRESIWAGK
jgi:hypothetical protein